MYVYNYDGGKIEKAISTKYYKEYGCLYTWKTSKLVCPVGWHLPTNVEWTKLIDYLGGKNLAVGKMISLTGWVWTHNGATNDSGFSALPGGYFYQHNYFDGVGFGGSWWSSTEYNKQNAHCWALSSVEYWYVIEYCICDKLEGHSVRCIKD